MDATQRAVLVALCDTFFPGMSPPPDATNLTPDQEAYFRRSASATSTPAEVERTLVRHVPPDTAREVGLLLTAMGSKWGMALIAGRFAPFHKLPLQDRVNVLAGMRTSWIGAKRKAFSSLRALIALKYHGPDSWNALGYDGPEDDATAAAKAHSTEFAYTFENESVTDDCSRDYDAVVVGSGCGGALTAAKLAQAGLKVAVLEKGKHFKRSQLTGSEITALDQLYECGGSLKTEDTGITVLAGSTFGGGSAVNWACSLRTPSYVRSEWASQGLSDFEGARFQNALDTVCEKLRVKTDGVAHNKCNEILMKGAKRCGMSVKVAGQNMADVSANAAGAGFISTGDRYGIKISVLENYLQDAARAGAHFYQECHVLRVVHENGVAKGVEAECVGVGGAMFRVRFNAPTVVSSCGSINTPALLLRSGLKNGNIGKNLRLHPVSAVTAIMPEDVKIWEGAPMTVVVEAGAMGRDGSGYGFKLESPSAHPPLLASGLEFYSPHDMKEQMIKLSRSFAAIVLCRDKGSGTVTIDTDGRPRLYYPLDAHDRQSLEDGLVMGLRVASAMGALEVGTGQSGLGGPVALPAEPKDRDDVLEALIARVRKLGVAPDFRTGIFSAHQMGTARMGVSPSTSVVKPNCESWDVSGLYVMDASTFPSSSGANPMITTLAIAEMMSTQLVETLAGRTSRL